MFQAIGKWLVAAALVAISLPVQAQQANATKAGQLAVFDFDGAITERPIGEELPFGPAQTESLNELVGRLKKAAKDDSVKGVVVTVGAVTLDSAQIEEIRSVMDAIRAAGKEIHAHTDSLDMQSYVLLSGASKITVVPTGDVWISGLYGSAPYLRGLFDKVGITPDFLTCGAYKSAAEMFMRTGPSPEAEKMQNWLLDSLFDTYVSMIAKGRGVDTAKVKQWIDGGLYSAERAKEAGIIDAIAPKGDFVASLKKQYGEKVEFAKGYGRKKAEEIDLSSPFAAFKLWAEILQGGPKKTPSNKPAIAVVYIEGPIMTGEADASPFGMVEGAFSTPIQKALDKAAEDEKVKAVVLRVNSPGGSAVASEIILNATKRVKAKKPFVVSMGDVAGSGGYYVACAADTIFADKSTITGSIGVVGGKFATTKAWEQFGINWRSYKRGANAGLLSSDAVFTKTEREKLQAWMDEIYGVFKGHVLAIRKDKLKKGIDELAGGRVYTGTQALELGLIDQLGSFDDALAFIAKQAKVEDYELRVLPEPKSFFEVLFGDLSGDKDEGAISMFLARRAPRLHEQLLPLVGALDPHHLGALRLALTRLELLQSERVVLMMPELIFSAKIH